MQILLLIVCVSLTLWRKGEDDSQNDSKVRFFENEDEVRMGVDDDFEFKIDSKVWHTQIVPMVRRILLHVIDVPIDTFKYHHNRYYIDDSNICNPTKTYNVWTGNNTRIDQRRSQSRSWRQSVYCGVE